jgi:multidrug resistance efflux pump
MSLADVVQRFYVPRHVTTTQPKRATDLRVVGADSFESVVADYGIAIAGRDSRIAQLEAELAAATKDARRYRWLRERGVTWSGDTAAFWLVDSIADYEIDAAIAATQANEGGKDG